MLTLAALLSAPAAAADLSIPANRDSTVGVHASQRGWSGYDYVLLGRRDNANGHERRAILDFDFSSVPSSSDITGAELTVEIDQVAGDPVNFTVHVVTDSWLEGTEVPANDSGTFPSGVSWKKSEPGVNWPAGGPHDLTVIGSGTMSAIGTATFTLDAVTIEDLRDTPGNGILLKPVGAAAGDLVRFDSREGAGAATLDLTLDGPIDNLDAVVASLAADINAVKPGFIDEMSTKVRARPSVIVASLREAVEALLADGCMTSSASANISNTSSGLYASGMVTGTHDTGAETGTASGTISTGPNLFAGTFADAGGMGVDHSFGGTTSGFTDLRLAADYATGAESGFLVGIGIRDQGSNGVFMAIHGVCDGMGSFDEALNGWVGSTVF